MSDSIAKLESAILSVQAAWEAEKKMYEVLVAVDYLQDDKGVRELVGRRAQYYEEALKALHKRVDEVRAERVANRNEIDKVAIPLLQSALPNWKE
jgi:hypothetical protein